MRRKGKRKEPVDFDMAPMIDMVFLLLVFFMTVSTLAQDTRPELILPDSSEAKINPEQTPGIVISLKAKPENKVEILFQGTPISSKQLSERIKNASAEDEDSEWIIRAEKDQYWSKVQPILTALRDEGVTKVRFSVFVK